MNHLETKRKAIAEKGLVLLPKEEAIDAILKQNFYVDNAVEVRGEKEVERELMVKEGPVSKYHVTTELTVYDRNEADRYFYLRLLDEGFELYRDRAGKLTIMPPDGLLQGLDIKRE